MNIRACLLLLLFSLASPLASQAAASEADSIVQVVSAFYKSFLSEDGFGSESYDWTKQPELDPAFVAKAERLINENLVDAHPVLWGQDKPLDMEYLTPVITGDTAEIIVNKAFGEGDMASLCVTLSKKDAQWRITDVIDMDWYEGVATLECGGLKRAPKE